MPADSWAQALARPAAPGASPRVTHTNLEEASEVEGTPREGLAQGHVDGQLGVVVVAAQLTVLARRVLDHEGAVAVEPAPAAVRVQQGHQGLQKALPQWRHQRLVQAQLM